MADSVLGQVDEDGAVAEKLDQEEEEDIEEYHDAKEDLEEQEESREQEGLQGQEDSEKQEDSNHQPAESIPIGTRDLNKDPPDDKSRQAQDPPKPARSYAAARSACIRDFLAIVTQCRQNNQKFTDPDFDLMSDFRGDGDFIFGLPRPPRLKKSNDGWGWNEPVRPFTFPGSVHRICEVLQGARFAEGSGRSNAGELRRELSVDGRDQLRVFTEKAQEVVIGTLFAISAWLLWNKRLTEDSTTTTWAFTAAMISFALFLSRHRNTRHSRPTFPASDIQQSGGLGDCWFMAAVASLAVHANLLQKVCVAWDQDCGVYGFLFYRDGAWIHTLVDDYVYLRERDFTPRAISSRQPFEQRSKAYKAMHQTGPDALKFAKCRSAQHTWVSLLEKAYAKVHGDYEALDGGSVLEALQDLTGGVAGYIRTDSISDRDALWRQLRRETKEFAFGLGSHTNQHSDTKEGLPLAHAFAIEGAYEFLRFNNWRVTKTKLLKIRNPWGTKSGLWQGSWSAGCANWSLLATWWLRPQLHEYGVFFMTLDDALETFPDLDVVRIMDEKKYFSRQKWTALRVHQPSVRHSGHEYNPVFFRLRLSKKSPITLALSQLDPRYFAKLQVGCAYVLDLAVKKVDETESGTPPFASYIARTCSRANLIIPALHLSLDSCLDAGTYDILVQLSPPQGVWNDKCERWTKEDLRNEVGNRRRKVLQLARNHDEAFRKLENLDPRLDMGQVRSLLGNPGGWAEVEEVCGVGLRVFSEDEKMSWKWG